MDVFSGSLVFESEAYHHETLYLLPCGSSLVVYEAKHVLEAFSSAVGSVYDPGLLTHLLTLLVAVGELLDAYSFFKQPSFLQIPAHQIS